MQNYISLLRGVNMTGHNTIRMTELATLYRKLGFLNVETYIQSGNVIFTQKDGINPENTAERIEDAIRKKFRLNISVIIRTADEMKRIINSNPFSTLKDFNPERLAVIFLHEMPDENQIGKVRNIDYPPDKFEINGKEIYIYCPNGFGRTKLYTNFFENKMKVTGSARNWKTVNTLYEISLKNHLNNK